jgi:hypothetical protein
MPVSLTTPGWTDPRHNAPVHVAFRKTDDVGTRDFQAFAAQWLAYAFPYRRFDAPLADCVARLGADAVCYSFTVADFHHLLVAGFAGAPVCLNFALLETRGLRAFERRESRMSFRRRFRRVQRQPHCSLSTSQVPLFERWLRDWHV